MDVPCSRRQGELRRIKAEVDWDREIGAVTRRVLEKKGPALLFENIKGYREGRCSKLFVSGLGARSRLALALGFPRDAPNRDLVQHVMKKNRETIPPVMVDDRAGEGDRHQGRRHRPDRVPGPEVALPRRRALHPHVFAAS